MAIELAAALGEHAAMVFADDRVDDVDVAAAALLHGALCFDAIAGHLLASLREQLARSLAIFCGHFELGNAAQTLDTQPIERGTG
jgi:hypothetical protein